MLAELEEADLDRLTPLLHSIPRDPMLYMLLEGNRPGRVFVDRLSRPAMALIWTGMEYAYLIGDSARAAAEVTRIVEQAILPALDRAGLDFVTIFPHGVPPAEVQAWFPERWPVSFGVNSFTFERSRFEALRLQARPLPPGYQLVGLDAGTLGQAACRGIRDDILFCWESLERFETLGMGYSILDPQGEAASACYAIGCGAGAFHINTWTRAGHRRMGLARRAAIACLNECLQQGRTIYWINDAPNIASRRLAESVGFVYAGDLATVDIPVHPHQFHLGLAEHFAGHLGLFRQAGELYNTAFAIQSGDPEAYRKAAQAWRQAGEPARAEEYQLKIMQTLHVTSRREWRAWLEKNHAVESEVWLLYYKKHTGQARIPYADAVEEALCFGWIDSTIRRVDDEKYAQKFTPRKSRGKWSEVNKRRAARLIQEGRMTQAGLAKISPAVVEEIRAGPKPKRKKRMPAVPGYVRQALEANGSAWENFQKLAPSYRRNYLEWIMSARREETRSRRLKEAVELLARNKKLGMK